MDDREFAKRAEAEIAAADKKKKPLSELMKSQIHNLTDGGEVAIPPETDGFAKRIIENEKK